MRNYKPIDYLIDLVCAKTELTREDFFTEVSNHKATMYFYLVIGLSYESFSKHNGKIRRLYTVNDISDYFNRAHPLVSIAKRSMNNWAELYVDYRIIKKYIEIKLNEKYCIYHKFPF